MYKLSQDHTELFFGTIGSHGGHNDNPTCRQFTTAYKKILILYQVHTLSCTERPAEDLTNDTNVIYQQTEL
jgi:hypothetical protein